MEHHIKLPDGWEESDRVCIRKVPSNAFPYFPNCSDSLELTQSLLPFTSLLKNPNDLYKIIARQDKLILTVPLVFTLSDLSIPGSFYESCHAFHCNKSHLG